MGPTAANATLRGSVMGSGEYALLTIPFSKASGRTIKCRAKVGRKPRRKSMHLVIRDALIYNCIFVLNWACMNKEHTNSIDVFVLRSDACST